MHTALKDHAEETDGLTDGRMDEIRLGRLWVWAVRSFLCSPRAWASGEGRLDSTCEDCSEPCSTRCTKQLDPGTNKPIETNRPAKTIVEMVAVECGG